VADFFFDTSALVKRFSQETGTAWVIDLIRPASGHIIYLATIASVEVVSAITRRTRGGHITTAAAKKALTRFHRSFLRRYVVVEINPPLISRATTLAETYALRGYDAVQLAAALTIHHERVAAGLPALTLISADNDLNAAATAEGLTVDDPNNHP
jgi:predicted nucleic acid-binding protein